MPFIAVTIALGREYADEFGDALLAQGALSVSVEDADDGTAAERPLFGEPGANPDLWDRCRLTALFAPAAEVRRIVADLAAGMGLAETTFTLATVVDEDWVARNREQFQPIVISPRIAIVPTWHLDLAAARAEIAIQLDPGAAFGTGSHPTTRLCLQWLEAHVDRAQRPRVLDYGTGSGILAIAARKLGAGETRGVDIDADAVRVARANAAQNDVDATFATTEAPLAFIADLTVANILASPLMVLAPLLAAHTRPGGRIALAGLLDEQAEEIAAIYSPWFQLTVWARAEGWSCLAGLRH